MMESPEITTSSDEWLLIARSILDSIPYTPTPKQVIDSVAVS